MSLSIVDRATQRAAAPARRLNRAVSTVSHPAVLGQRSTKRPHCFVRARSHRSARSPTRSTYRHGATGKGVTVYVFDGGVSQTHPELAGRVRVGYTAFPDDPKICNAHGTAVAGAIAGATLGVAPDAEIVDVKMVQCDKLRGTIKAIVDGARWVIEDHKTASGPGDRELVVHRRHVAAHSRARQRRRPSSARREFRSSSRRAISRSTPASVSPGNSQGTIVVGASASR